MKDFLEPFVPSLPMLLLAVWMFIIRFIIFPPIKRREKDGMPKYVTSITMMGLMFGPMALLMNNYDQIVKFLFRLLGK